MKKLFTIGIIFTLALLSACSPQPLQTIAASKYYVQINDEGEEYTQSDDTRYEYEMVGFDKVGEAKELTFTARHQLKQGAYLIIYYKNNKVITYEEVNDADIPEKAQALLQEEA